MLKGKNEEKVNVLVPSSLVKLGCCVSNNLGIPFFVLQQPSGSNILTTLLLALPSCQVFPPRLCTWSLLCHLYGKNVKTGLWPLCDIHWCHTSIGLVDSVASYFNTSKSYWHWQVLHLRRQLYLLKKCQENKGDEDLSAHPACSCSLYIVAFNAYSVPNSDLWLIWIQRTSLPLLIIIFFKFKLW